MRPAAGLDAAWGAIAGTDLSPLVPTTVAIERQYDNP